MEIYALLKQDHTKVKSLFKELEATSEQAVKTREELFSRIHEELDVHAEAEEKLFYPKLKSAEPTRDIVLEAYEEHRVVKKLLRELAAQNKGTEAWLAKAKVLIENVEHHVKEEEGELFKKARQVLSDEEAEAIAEAVQLFKAELKAGVGG